MELLIPALIAVIILFIFFRLAMAPGGQAATIEGRLSSFAERPRSLEELELELPFRERVIRPLMGNLTKALGRLSPSQNTERVRLNLAQAGNPNNMGVTEFSGLRIVAAMGMAIATLLLTVFVLKAEILNILLMAIIAAVVGYLLPGIWLGQKIKARKKAILRQLPDVIDLLTVCVEAGLALDSAMQRVSEKYTNDLGKEFHRVLSETRVGKRRTDALREMVLRTGVPDLATFVSAVIQADQLGVSMAKVLRIQSDQMRIKRRQRAEEQAHRAPVIMIFPMVFLIFPAMYVVILGPSVPRFIETFFAVQ
ncbi:MAG TPA: type II secretion system F family protein [Chloroflexia bacterium]|jgi:tight adherence protein C|nr:type II secretion system F family protein [Chloroflexia bacterium]